MSRIGKNPIPLPEKVKAGVQGGTVTVEGPKGSLRRSFPDCVKVRLEENRLVVEPAGKSRLAKAMHGTARSLLAGMVQGVTGGFAKDLEISGVGFRAVLEERALVLNLGYASPIRYPVPDGIQVTVADNTKIKVEGTDKQQVGQTAADIKHFYKVEPYKGKGVRLTGEYVRRKEGKKAG